VRQAGSEFHPTPTERRLAGGGLIVVSFLVVLGGALVVGWLLDTIDEDRAMARWDEAAAEWGAANVGEVLEDVLVLVTELGGTTLLFVVMTVVGLVMSAKYGRPSGGAFLAIVGIGIVLVNNGLKLWVDRERPAVAPLVGTSGASFPSGHSAAAAACWAAIALVATRRSRRPVRVAASGGAVAVALTVASTRVLLGVHWVTDVVAGLVVGWSWFALVAIVFGGRLLRLGEPAEDLVAAANPDSSRPTDFSA
jgi:membrane-associated phospholipid phosphatase